MSNSIRFVGLDVHSKTVAMAVAEDRRDPEFVGMFPNDFSRVLQALDRLAPRDLLYCSYEAGPTGYGLQRKLSKLGIQREVIAPSKMPRASGDRVKTDRKMPSDWRTCFAAAI